MIMNDLSPDRQNKFKAYRERKKAAGFKRVSMWVPDFKHPAMKAALDDQIKRINASEDERLILEMLEDNAQEMWPKD